MNQNNVAVLHQDESSGQLAPQQGFGSQGLLMDFEKIRAMQELANIMATAKVTVPAHLAGKTGDCLAVIMQAAQWGMNPFAVAQKTHVVSGTLGYEAQLVNAVVQASGAIVGRFHYEYQGDGPNVSCRVGAVLKGEKEITWNEFLSAASVTTKNSTLWKTNPKQQLGYLQVKNWARAYAPGAIMGVYTPDEIEDRAEARDMGAADVVDTRPSSNTKTSALKDKLGAGKNKQAGPVLADVLRAIEAAHDGATMAAAKAMGAQMADGADKDKAIEAYGRRVAALKAQAEQQTVADPQTGEILGPEGDLPFDEQDDALRAVEQGAGMSLQEVTAALNSAANLDALYLAADLIKAVADEKQREQLGALYAKRKKQIGE